MATDALQKPTQFAEIPLGSVPMGYLEFNLNVVTLETLKTFKLPPQQKVDKTYVRALLETVLIDKKKHGKILPIGLIPIAKLGEDTYMLDKHNHREAYMILEEPATFLVQEFVVTSDKDITDLVTRIQDEHRADIPGKASLRKSLPPLAVAPSTEAAGVVPVNPVVPANTMDGPCPIDEAVYEVLMNYIRTTYVQYISANGVKPHHPNITLQDLTSVLAKIPGSNEWTVDNVVDKFEEFNMECKKALETSSVAHDRDRLSKSQRGKSKPLYINRAVLYLLRN